MVGHSGDFVMRLGRLFQWTFFVNDISRGGKVKKHDGISMSRVLAELR
jgi:hypothetical protein